MSEEMTLHEKIITEAISVVKFSSHVFRVFILTMNRKGEKKLRLLSRLASSEKNEIERSQIEVTSGFHFLHYS